MSDCFPTFHKLGLDTHEAEKTNITVSASASLHSDAPQASLLPCHQITVTDLETLKDLCGSPLQADSNNKDGSIAGLLTTYLSGHRPLTDQEHAHLTKMVLPVDVTVAAAESITIKTGTVLTLGNEDGRPATYDYSKITLEEGGQIKVISPVTLNTVDFEKVKPQ